MAQTLHRSSGAQLLALVVGAMPADVIDGKKVAEDVRGEIKAAVGGWLFM